MATNTNRGAPLTGLDALFASQDIAATPRGGVETGFSGVSGALQGAPTAQGANANLSLVPDEQQDPLQGMGELLEAEDSVVFETLHNLVLRQERLAKNRLAIDTHWTRIVLNYPWSRLEKVQDQDIWKAVLPPGSEKISPAATPNKAADLCNKIVETLMVDPPQPSPRAENDSEEAERGAEMCKEFLVQDGDEPGTNDADIFWQATDASTSRSSAFTHYWVDKTGGGCVPLQIKAHPQAADPARPLIGPEGLPTTDPVLRYVTAPSEQFPAGQFTLDPAQADLQWLPKIKVDHWGREHIRIFPETKDVWDAEFVIGLYYCTLGEAKKRWENVANLSEDDCAELLDWTPPRYLVLLPPALRARWRLQTAGAKDAKKGSAADERLMFYYVLHRLASPDYPKGATIYVSGAFDGFVLEKDILAATVPAAPHGSKTVHMDLPVGQVRLIIDAHDRDPTGRALIERFGGANEATSTLFTAYLEAIDIILHPAKFIPSTSPVEGWQIEQSRGTGDPVPVLSKDDYPHYEEPRQIPSNFLEMVEFQYQEMDSISGSTKPAQGADNQQEVSGVARSIAVRQALVALSRMQQALLKAYKRHWRIKLQLAMKEFTVPQLIRYEGEDGAYKQEWWSGVDFSLVTDVGVAAGTGTMMPPQEKVNYISAMRQSGFLQPDEAADAARPTFSDTLGLPPNPHQQRIERQVSTWLKGPPSPDWIAQYQQYQAQMQQYQQAMLPYQQQAQAQAARVAQLPKVNIAMKADETNVAAEERAAIAGEQPGAPAPPVQQLPPPPPPPQSPWTPFTPLPHDDEIEIATIRKLRLAKLLSTARFTAQPPEWQAVAITEYQRMRQVLATAAVQAAGQPTQPRAA
jgi:hypothetical protein